MSSINKGANHSIVLKQHTQHDQSSQLPSNHSNSLSNNNSYISNTISDDNSTSTSSSNSTHKRHKRRGRKKNKKNTNAKIKQNSLQSNTAPIPTISLKIDTNTNANTITMLNNRMQHLKISSNDLPSIPANVDIRNVYKRKKLKHSLLYGQHICVDIRNIHHLKKLLGSKKCQMYGNIDDELFNKCVVCEEICVEGELAIETVLFIPKKNNPACNNLGRFRCQLPRVCCWDCCKEDGYKVPNVGSLVLKSIAKVWQTLLDLDSNSNMNNGALDSNGNKLGDEGIINQKNSSNMQQFPVQFSSSPFVNHTSMDSHQKRDTFTTDAIAGDSQGNKRKDDNGNEVGGQPSESEQDPFDDGFLICTQLVKTGGADQGGLQVGDVFVKFGVYSKAQFPGLKSIANLVRRSAGTEIDAIVWRKLEQSGNGEDDDGSGRTVFQKLALKLRPLQSHDADGGGVLGSVVNSYPLPEMHN